jgi:hypothetical protein
MCSCNGCDNRIAVAESGGIFHDASPSTMQRKSAMKQTQAVIALIEDYFNLAYEPKSRDFMKIFHPSCLVQWVQDGRLSVMSSQEYAVLIQGRPSPRSIGAPRDEAILSIENISDILSAATVRVRIGAKLFNDHFVMHKVEENWLIATKASFAVRTFD